MSNSKQRRTERRAASRDGLQNLMAGLGTSRDKMSYSQYALRVLDHGTLETMYRQSWLAKKIVNAPAEDMTRAWRQVMFDEPKGIDRDVSKQFAVEETERALCVQSKIRTAIKWSRLFGGGVLVLGMADRTPEKPLDPQRVKRGDLRYIHAMDRWQCSAGTVLDWDIESANFGRPEFYMIGSGSSLVRIHHSRVVPFTGVELPYNSRQSNGGWGDSELQAVYDTLLGRDTVTAGIATMLFEANVDVMKVAGLGDMLSTDEGEAQLTKRFQLAAMMKSFNRMLLIDEGETYEKRSNSFSGLDAIVREFRAEVAGAADIPVSRLFGISASGLNATGDNDVRNYYDSVSAKQESDLRPALERLDEIMIRSALGAMPDDYRFEFMPLWQMDDTERANVRKTEAETDRIYFDMGVLTEGSIARELKERGTYATMTEEDVELAQELAEGLEEEDDPTDPNADPEGDPEEGAGVIDPEAEDE